MHAMTHIGESSAPAPPLLLAFDLMQRSRTQGFVVGQDHRPSERRPPRARWSY